jgi:chromosome segregation ATPase
MKARERLGPKCVARSVQAEALEAFVWNDVKEFVKRPEVALAQLRSQATDNSSTLSEQLAAIERQIEEYRRREYNLLRVAAESTQVDISALDGVLEEVRASLATATSLREELKKSLGQRDHIEKDLLAAADRLNRLQSRIDKASYQEKRRAIEALVKRVDVDLQQIGRKKVALVTVTYRFDEPGSNSAQADKGISRFTHSEVVADSSTSRRP